MIAVLLPTELIPHRPHFFMDHQPVVQAESSTDSVVIVGGGLAGLSAAEAMARAGHAKSKDGKAKWKIQILEAKQAVGGRAGSFVDSVTGEATDYCQHVAMGCCHEFIGLMERCGLMDEWKRDQRLSFHYPGYDRSDLAPSDWLPPPLHLLSALRSLSFLTNKPKSEIQSGLFRLMRTPTDRLRDVTARDWLCANGQGEQTIERFWDVFLVSALGEQTAKVSMSAARKVFIDGFAAVRGASDILVPRLPLSELIGVRLRKKVESLGVQVRSGCRVRRIDSRGPDLHGADSHCIDSRGPDSRGTAAFRLELSDGTSVDAGQLIVAVPWYRLQSLFADVDEFVNAADELAKFNGSPISGIHLWLDRQITKQPHAVMVGTLSQWLFQQPVDRQPKMDFDRSGNVDPTCESFYYQVVISASHQERRMPNDELIEKVMVELANEFPDAREAKLLHARVVTDPNSVFSMTPAVESARRLLRPAISNFYLAGDWTDTGWPATMEGAVISGRKAAAELMKNIGMGDQVLPEVRPKPGWLAKCLIRD